MWKSGHSVQRDSSGIAKTPDDGCLRPWRVVKGRADGNSRIIKGIILCIKEQDVNQGGTDAPSRFVNWVCPYAKVPEAHSLSELNYT
jgi:hypothetical protein